MRNLLGRLTPIISSAIAIAVATIVLLDFVIESSLINGVGALLVDYGLIVGAFALILGVANVLLVHARHARARAPGWLASIMLIVVVLGLLIVGMQGANGSDTGPNSAIIAFTFDYILVPLQAATFSLLAFFILHVAYQGLRVTSWESFFLLLGVTIVIIGSLPLGGNSSALAAFKDFFLSVPVTAGARGIVLGIAMGVIATSMRLLFDGHRYFK